MNKNIEYVNRRQKRVKEALIKAHGEKCNICKYNRCNRALEFHHIDPSTKDFTISKNSKISSFNRLLEESKKCILVCSNCHREIEDGLYDSEYLKSKKLFDNNNIVIPDYTPKAKLYFCKKCNTPINKASINCKKCRLVKSKIIWPTKNELEKMVWELPTTSIAKTLGVSDKAVEKRCKKYEITKPPRGYWSGKAKN